MWFDLSPHPSGPGSAPNLLSQAPPLAGALLAPLLRPQDDHLHVLSPGRPGRGLLLSPELLRKCTIKELALPSGTAEKTVSQRRFLWAPGPQPPAGLVALLTGTSPGSGMLPLARWAECWLGSPPPGRWSRSQLHELPGGAWRLVLCSLRHSHLLWARFVAFEMKGLDLISEVTVSSEIAWLYFFYLLIFLWNVSHTHSILKKFTMSFCTPPRFCIPVSLCALYPRACLCVVSFCSHPISGRPQDVR